MSFKRADDDNQSFHELRRRRVGDLLGEDIADDEVTRLSNGRLTCLVCHHRPIFDTLDMFCVHRQGKKHTQNAAYKAVEKQELQDLIMKRKHDQFVKTGNTNIQQAPAQSLKGLGHGKPYDPRTKKRTKPYDRKQTLDIGALTSDVKYPLESTSLEDLPGNKEDFSAFNRKTRTSINANTMNDSNKVLKQPYSANTGGDKNHEKDYDKQFGKLKSKGKASVHLSTSYDSVLHTKEIEKFVSQYGQDQDPSHYFARRKRLKAETSKLETGLSRQNADSNASQAKSTVDWEKFQKYKAAIMSGPNKSVPIKHGKQRDNSAVKPTDKLDPTIHSNTVQTEQASDKEKVTALDKNSHTDKRAQAERELQLRGAGWKRDWTGKWVKDQDAEFDSDEEMPDLP